VRKSGNRVRIAAELINAKDGHEVDVGVIEIVNINDAISALSAPEATAPNPDKGTPLSTNVNA
jgi:hypothetical protein